MGVYVKGMKMPESHLSCPFRGAITEMCIASEKWCNGFNEDCPLVELPKHGRLIDADAIDTSYSDPEVIETLNTAPTVLEADE